LGRPGSQRDRICRHDRRDVAADAISYGVSTVTLLLIRAREPRRDPAAVTESSSGATGFAGLRRELFAGLAFVFWHPVLRKDRGVHRHGELVRLDLRRP
jgi:hypothetical protein